MRRPLALGLVTIFLLLGGLGGWAGLTEISGAVTASGRIEVAQSSQVVQHPDGGVVEAILVNEGDAVTAGAPLLRLDGAWLRSERAIVESQFFETLARQGRLEAERDGAAQPAVAPELATAATAPEIAGMIQGQARLFTARRESHAQLTAQLDRRVAQIESQISGLDAQSRATERQLELLGEELTIQLDLLDRGLAQAARALALQREHARLQGNIGALEAERAHARGAITEIAVERQRLDSIRREEAETGLRDLGVHALELAERRRALGERISRLELRAPVSGVVHGLQVTTPRAVLRAADPVLHLVPQDRPLVVAARIDPADVDQVTIGQTAQLRLTAFSMRSTPELPGTVALLSPDAFTDATSGKSYYRAEITLEPDRVDLLEGRTLRPGMPVEVFFQTEPRSPLAYFVKPISDYFLHAFRDH